MSFTTSSEIQSAKFAIWDHLVEDQEDGAISSRAPIEDYVDSLSGKQQSPYLEGPTHEAIVSSCRGSMTICQIVSHQLRNVVLVVS